VTIRCFALPAQWSDHEIILDRDESHHLLRVMRLETGARVFAHDGHGHIAKSEIADISGRKVTLRILEQTEYKKQKTHIILVQSLIKKQKMDGVLQKAVELGASEIIGLETEHAVVRIKENEYAQRIARWQAITQSAIKQCGRPWIPQLTIYASMQQLLTSRTEIQTWLICSMSQPDAQPLHEIIHTPPCTTEKLAVMIGPEGDFSPRELEQALQANAIPVTLGTYVLRAETAALYALSLLVEYPISVDCNAKCQKTE